MTGSGMDRNQRGVSRVLAKLDKAIEEGNFYESHQMYRTLYFRYTALRKFDDCLDLLYNGAQKLISKLQETSAADLGLLIIDTLEKRGSGGEGDAGDVKFWIERIGSIISQLNASVVERETLINRALKWSGEVSGNNLGHPTMHKIIAQVFWSENNLEMARHHFIMIKDGPLCGRVLIKISTSKGFKSEVDLFIVQAVLQQLCLMENKTAEETFCTYTTNHPMIRQSSTPYYLPLLNFLYFLFRSIESGSLASFRTLCSLYKPSLNRDPAFDKYLTKIGTLFFNAAPRNQSGGLFGGLFGDLFSQMFQDFDGDDNGRQQGNARIGADRIQHELD